MDCVAAQTRTEAPTSARAAMRGQSDAVALAGLGLVVIVRPLVAGRAGASSIPAAGLFAVALAGLALASGWRPGGLRWLPVLSGLAAGGVFVLGPVLVRGAVVASGAPGSRLAVWSIVVSMVAVVEEAFFRGALWMAFERRFDSVVALLSTTIAFAVIHVPLYGWRAVPLDLGVGLGLGALRVWSGGVSASAVAHVVADLAGGWL